MTGRSAGRIFPERPVVVPSPSLAAIGNVRRHAELPAQSDTVLEKGHEKEANRAAVYLQILLLERLPDVNLPQHGGEHVGGGANLLQNLEPAFGEVKELRVVE